MKSVLIAFLFLLVALTTATEEVFLFDCNRPTQKCPEYATCNTTTKLCSGCQSRNGYACEANAPDAANSTVCNSAPCQNGGTCLTDGTCRCSPANSGPTCSNETISLTCGSAVPGDDDSMVLDVRALIGAQHSQVIVDGSSGDPRCTGDNGRLQIVNMDTAANPGCKNATKRIVAGGTLYERVFLVRFKAGITSPNTDFRVKAECGPSGLSFKLPFAEFNVTDDTGKMPVRDVGHSVAGANVTTELTIDGNPLSPGTPYQLTDVIDIRINLDTSSNKFATIRVESFTVDNRGNPPKSIQLIKDSCPTPDAEVVMKTQPRQINESEIVFQTVPIIIDPTVLNYYTIIVRICRDNERDKCQPLNCTSETARRKKRDTDNDIATTSVGFRVQDQTSLQRDVSDIEGDSKNKEECILSTEMTSTLVAMAVAILLLLSTVLVLVIRAVLAHRREVTVYQHQPLQDSISTTSLPKLVNTSY